MGIGSNLMVELAEERDKKEKSEWIQAQLDDLDADEFTDGWNELSEQYDTYNVSDDEQDFFDFEIWKVKGKTKVELFNEQIKASKEVLNSKFSSITSKNILVMLQGHVVASVEAYLSSTFIDVTLSSDFFLRKLVENDPELAKSKFSLKDIFTKQYTLRNDIGKYLQSLIFHKIDKVNLLYDSVLDINFGNVKWLYEAVELRHHCVHRAGYDKDGYEVSITGNDIEQLILKCCKLVHTIESQIIKLPDSTDSF
jgi:hypothetical protein